MEAPPGFEPGMEVLQASAALENTPKPAVFPSIFSLLLGWRWVKLGVVLLLSGTVRAQVGHRSHAPDQPGLVQKGSNSRPVSLAANDTDALNDEVGF